MKAQFTWDSRLIDEFEPARITLTNYGITVAVTLGTGVEIFERCLEKLHAEGFPDQKVPFFQSTQFGFYIPNTVIPKVRTHAL